MTGKGYFTAENQPKRAFNWRGALEKAIMLRDEGKPEAQSVLVKLWSKAIDQGLEGDLGFFKEIGERLAGKVTQPIGGDPEHPLVTRVEWEIVEPKDQGSGKA